MLINSVAMLHHDVFSSPDSYRIQKTLKCTASFKGVGLHSGQVTSIRILPAGPNHGVVFERTDLSRPYRIYAHFDSVVATEMATTLGHRDRSEARISTVEHLLAALFALGVTNALIKVDGPEIPILDGSAGPFVEGILEAGFRLQFFSTPVLRVLKPIKLYKDGTVCELLPRDRLRVTTSIDFPHPSIGLQTFALELTPLAFQQDIGEARTFGFQREVDNLRAKSLAMGASIENVLGFSDKGVLNPGGMRFHDECARHKLLDAIGDLALCGSWIEGELVSFRSGHSVHLGLLQFLKSCPTHWTLRPAEPIMAPQVSEKGWARLAQPSISDQPERSDSMEI